MADGVETQGLGNVNPTLSVCCKKCGGNAGRIMDGALVYTVKHSGEHHTIRIDLEWLKKVLQAAKV